MNIELLKLFVFSLKIKRYKLMNQGASNETL
jgi:hypothetical protein